MAARRTCYPRGPVADIREVEPAWPGHRALVRIATFNILHGHSPEDDRVDVERFAAAVKTLDADVLGLQEVDRDQPRSMGADLTAVAAEAMGAPEHQFVAALSGTPGGTWMAATGHEQPGSASYGIALLSRYPVVSWRVVRLPPPRASGPVWAAPTPRGVPPPRSGGLLAGGGAAAAAGQRPDVVAADPAGVPRARRAAGRRRGGARRPVRAVHRVQHPPVLHPGVERRATAPVGAVPRRYPGTAGPHRRPQHAAAAGRPHQWSTPDRLRRDVPHAGTAPAVGPRAGARSPAGHRPGPGGAPAAVGSPGARRPLWPRQPLPDRSRPQPDGWIMNAMASTGPARVFSLLASIVRAVTSVIAALIVVHAVFVLFEANPQNILVEFTTGWRDTFGWFTKDLFAPSDPKIAEAVNDALAAILWVVVGTLLSKLIVRLTPASKAKA